ncbi:hypothetical protein L227DRAFT_579187 [Lentinus tigrinus ALCF2SS1-6]|uniref:Uncharacterized protein n=1 Tax=Lentinus tigrinus ALCF2SS1-6 TaxID=1328759 RepID=A0A5C2RY45_9APHY|nr:hypothetical protein L227DRAFT_579187 [Lentinus tigrinus ALCF2SS1-6]
MSEGLQWDDKFRFDDGSIVLVAGTTAFKVYKGLLSAQSHVFSDMLFAGNPHATQVFDGCPVVHLSDSPEDLRHLLRTLISKEQILVYAQDFAHAYTFDQLSALTRLSHKYGIESVERQAIACLKTYYADTFEAWEGAKGFRAMPEAGQGIGAIRLARLTNNPAMLPVAFYECAILGGKIVQGWTREDGTVERLGWEDLERCIDGYGALCRMIDYRIECLFKVEPCAACTSRIRCKTGMRDLYADQIEFKWKTPRLLHSVADEIEEWARDYSLCEHCAELIKEHDRSERRDLWARLPSIFGLSIEGWGTG